MIDIDGLTRRYGDTTVVDAVTLQVQQGELLALVGGSGAGKSIPLGVLVRRVPRIEGPLLAGVGAIQTIPALALLAGMIGAIPPYDAVVIVGRSFRRARPDVVAALGELDGRIPVEQMRASNLAVDRQGRSPAVVAQDLLNALRRRGSDAAPAR